ncbi:SDR family oxidoreductase [Raoultella ornithinolytica]|uniref:SDR family oxidoreductase n=1 Tax=Raoultella ornithinolytica TaxID=54291 RepID=UPI00292BCA79|nr:SDR family oxidoreductase [Raoultella ornithinolytica]MDV1095117.1 SDR family oxidoreductase [Raoultella ornithinolytica]MDV1122646.1 SDR family oxidoreductase [Raoultella ornithinolytica]MDV1893013.1 SDR family oxidoreductase [Raoultella ornithinolytica]
MAKKTLIIGGSSGIGFAVAGALAEQGESLILAGRDGEKLARARQLLSQESASVDTVVLDISKEAEVIQLSQTLGEVDNIIVTAGSHAPGGALTSLDLNEARLAFDSKFWGSIHVARHLSKNISARGALTLTSGFVSRRTVAGAIVKTTMNAALESAVKVLAKELSPLRVNAVSPGLTDTEAYAGMDPAAREKWLASAAETLPAKAFGRAEDIAKGYLFVMDNPLVTGSLLDIEGGALIN